MREAQKLRVFKKRVSDLTLPRIQAQVPSLARPGPCDTPESRVLGATHGGTSSGILTGWKGGM